MQVLPEARLFGVDFDKTIARTDERSPRGLTVDVACEQALREMFGVPGLLHTIGGLQSRAPVEIVRDVIRSAPRLRDQGWKFFRDHKEDLRALVPQGKGHDLRKFDSIDLIEVLGEVFVRIKLRLLISEVQCLGDDCWPRMCDGFADAYRELRARDRKVAVVTSGHDLFLEKCFDLWKLPRPHICLTDDDMRAQPLPIEKKIKPSPVLIDLVQMNASARGIKVGRNDMVFIGDDEEKDGGLAHNANIPFGWYNPYKMAHKRPMEKDDFEITSWREAAGV